MYKSKKDKEKTIVPITEVRQKKTHPLIIIAAEKHEGHVQGLFLPREYLSQAEIETSGITNI